MSKPRITVITVCYLAEKSIAKTISSVLAQDLSDFEYIIIDGASFDKTKEVIMSFRDERIKLISEKDEGLYDAMNKGIQMSSGEIICMLHSDDVFKDEHVLTRIVELFGMGADTEAISSSVEIYRGDKLYRYFNAALFRRWQFRLGMQPPHPGFFVRRKALDKVGYYRTIYKISGDFDWLLRAILIHRLKVLYTPEVTVMMSDGGLSSSGWRSRKKMNNENLKILKFHGIYSNKLLIYLKYFLKIFQLRLR